MASSLKVFQKFGKKVWGSIKDVAYDPPNENFNTEALVHNHKDDQATKALRELLLQEGTNQSIIDDHTLLRFLHMRDYDIAKAKESYLDFLKWREDFGVDTIAKEFKFEEYGLVQKFYPHGFHGVDRNGRPVYIDRTGLLNLDALLQITTLERLVKHHVYEQEKTMRLRFPACSIAAGKRISSTTAILDVKGIGTSSFSKQARYLFLEFQKIDSNYYPDTLNRLYIVNAGSGFRVLWKALKTFLDTRTTDKIQVLGSNFRGKLIEVIDPSNLPAFLGGECTCDNHGGCMLSDKGPWNDLEVLQLMKNEQFDGTSVEDIWVSAQSTPDNYNSAQLRKEGKKENISETIQQLQITVEDAGNKFRAMENALGETKLMLQRVSEQIKDLQMQLLAADNLS